MIAYRITEKGKKLIDSVINAKSPPITILNGDALELAEVLCRLTFEADYFTFAPEYIDEDYSALALKKLELLGYIEKDTITQEADKILAEKQDREVE